MEQFSKKAISASGLQIAMSSNPALAAALASIECAESRIPSHQLTPVNVVRLRTGLGMTRSQFARRFGFPAGTLRHWERGDREPTGAALVLLNILERNPHAVMKALTTARLVPRRERPGDGEHHSDDLDRPDRLTE
ncbi:MAG TPA: helix-turn-helix domain-containing protein [Usitatibacter sp.]|nr:helix-turn-helix domain-containing protein [Usitatibacter sp.]